jgi:hypothetical protein
MTKMILAKFGKYQDLDLLSTHRLINYIREDGRKKMTGYTTK